ncbi:type II secretion system secretin GspD [Thauera sedimentorum]|nr:type II secretion system secretin GspD [Thauera sedimentorum]
MKLDLWMRRVLLCGACAVILPAMATEDKDVSLNFVNADIHAVIDAIGRITGTNFLVDPRVKGTLNIVTNTPVSRDLSYQILLSALRMQGIAAVEGGGIVKIVPEADAKLHGVPVSSGRTVDGGDRLVTQVFPMQHESAAQMLTVVRPLVSPNNTVTAFPANNVLVVTDYAENINRIARIIESVDVPQGDVAVIELKHAIAVDLATTVGKLLNAGNTPANGAPGDAALRVQVLPEPRTNSLLVRSENPARLRAVRQLVASLDKPGAGGNIHVVYLRNAEAIKVAETLNGALSQDGATSVGNTHSAKAPLGSQTDEVSSTSSSSSRLSTDQAVSVDGGSGMIQADPINNALIIVAPDAVYRNLRHVIDKLDRRRAQVYIEALIAEVSSDRAAEFGIQWQNANLPVSGSGVFGGTNFGGSGQNLIGAMGDITSVGKGLNLLFGKGTVKVPINGELVEVFSLGVLARFLETDSRTNILSTPNIVTLDNEEAKIVVGRNLPFVTGQYTNTGGGTTPVNPFQTIERRDVGLTLEVRPQISEGGAIKLEIYQEASSVLPTVDATAGPTTNKRSIKSTVLVDDGAIIALGGLMEDSMSAGEEKVPLLGDIPFAGELFKYTSRKRAKTNLVVFLRPQIIRDQDDYAEMSRSRYDYVIGQQREISEPVRMLRNEPAAPELPKLKALPPAEREGAVPAVPAATQSPAPVQEIDLVRLAGRADE